MVFTYTYDLVNVPRDRVRYEAGDTDGEAYFLEDEEIDALLTLHSDDWQLASLAAIRGIIAKLNRPTFQADWLKVDNKVAIDGYRKLLAAKVAEYGVDLGETGVAWVESGSVDVMRSDVTEWVDPIL